MRTNLWLTDPEKRRWLAIRKNAGRKIDPQTALVSSSSVYVIDPYGLIEDLADEAKCVGNIRFARSPGSAIAVCFYDLPRATVSAIEKAATAGSSNVVAFAPRQHSAGLEDEVDIDEFDPGILKPDADTESRPHAFRGALCLP